jgi:hypothetical protein
VNPTHICRSACQLIGATHCTKSDGCFALACCRYALIWPRSVIGLNGSMVCTHARTQRARQYGVIGCLLQLSSQAHGMQCSGGRAVSVIRSDLAGAVHALGTKHCSCVSELWTNMQPIDVPSLVWGSWLAAQRPKHPHVFRKRLRGERNGRTS